MKSENVQNDINPVKDILSQINQISLMHSNLTLGWRSQRYVRNGVSAQRNEIRRTLETIYGHVQFGKMNFTHYMYRSCGVVGRER